MKKIITLATLGLLVAAAPISAQTVYDAAKITGKDLNGTARFVGMGGAMGALGGDISTIGTNIWEINLSRIKCKVLLIIWVLYLHLRLAMKLLCVM